MGPKTLFLVLMKAIGVFLVAGNIGVLVRVVVNALRQLDAGTGIAWVVQLQSGLPALALIGLGIYMFLGGRWIADLAVPSNRPRCDDCGYDVAIAQADRCPECGAAIGND